MEGKAMEIAIKKRAIIVSGTSNPELAKDIADHLGMVLEEVDITRFESSEVKVRFPNSVRGADAFVIQSHSAPVNEMIMEQLIMIDALKRASAKRINAVIPFFGYGQQDRKAVAREPITGRLLANLLEVAGADRVLSVDLHTGQIQGFFNIPVDHLTALPLLADYVTEKYGKDLVVVAPDAGGARQADKYALHMGATGVAFAQKRRRADEPNITETIGLVGEVAGRRCVIVDELIDTAGSLIGCLDFLLERGATEVIAVATHPRFSGKALERLRDSAFTEVVVTNTMHIERERPDKITVLSIAPLIASTIKAVFEDESVSEIFRGEHLDFIPPEYRNHDTR
jgi:ribose-phosphate pyrophosphokinase